MISTIVNYPWRFLGDGREKIYAQARHVQLGTQPTSVTRSQARRACERFHKASHSSHSPAGATLWVVLEYCAHNKLLVEILSSPGNGYYVQVKGTKCPASMEWNMGASTGPSKAKSP